MQIKKAGNTHAYRIKQKHDCVFLSYARTHTHAQKLFSGCENHLDNVVADETVGCAV